MDNKRAPASSPEVDRVFAPYRGDVPGASIAVVHAGRVLLTRSYGLATLQPRVDSTTRTNYRLASVSKQFTAMAVLILVNEGKLTLDASVAGFLPELSAHRRAATVRHLLTHTSGLWDYEDLITDPHRGQLSDHDVLELLREEERAYFEPGAQFRYSNSGYALLALIVERTSGTSFPRFLEQRIFGPLGMVRTMVPEWGKNEPIDRALGYSMDKGHWIENDQSATSAVMGDGGVYSSTEDLIRWHSGLSTGVLVPKKLDHLATSRATLEDGTPIPYGFGWFLDTQREAVRRWHTGRTAGFRNCILVLPGSQLMVAVLTNSSVGDPLQLAERVARIFEGPRER